MPARSPSALAGACRVSAQRAAARLTAACPVQRRPASRGCGLIRARCCQALIGLVLAAGCSAGIAAPLANEPPAPRAAATLAGEAAPSAAARANPAAPLYRYKDALGRTVYSNRPPPPGIAAHSLPYAPSPPRRPSPPAAPQPPGLSHDPRHPAPTLEPPGRGLQQAVLGELARQAEALEQARSALKQGEAVRSGDERNYQRYLDRIQGLRDAVTRQEGVLEALQKQLRLLGPDGLAE